MTEEDRAAEYRRMMQAREDNKLLAELALSGSQSAFDQALEDYSPLVLDEGWDPVRRMHLSEYD